MQEMNNKELTNHVDDVIKRVEEREEKVNEFEKFWIVCQTCQTSNRLDLYSLGQEVTVNSIIYAGDNNRGNVEITCSKCGTVELLIKSE